MAETGPYPMQHCSICKVKIARFCLSSDDLVEECGVAEAYFCTDCLPKIRMTEAGGFKAVAIGGSDG